jgi:hypothetical protein
MAKQEPKKLSELDKSFIGKYSTVFDNKIKVQLAKDKLGNEFLEIANCVPEFQTPLFEKVTVEHLKGQIKANLITKI